jgi:predicted alpha/beta-hydrolase family hydrolase
MRNQCALKELRRLRMFEKGCDASTRCPYARAVKGWVVAGLGNGARIAASIGAKRKHNIVGAILMSYPLWEPTPPAGKGSGAPNSTGPLGKLGCPLLFIQAQRDTSVSLTSLLDFCKQLQSPHPLFFVQVANVDVHFRAINDGRRYTAEHCSQVRRQLRCLVSFHQRFI